MAKNYMEQVAKMLGVELGEKFEIKGHNEKCRITEGGLFCDGYNVSFDTVARRLLTGELEVNWKPKEHELYWTINRLGVIKDYIWDNSEFDHLKYKVSNCFKTREEITDELVERYKQFLNNGERVEW